MQNDNAMFETFRVIGLYLVGAVVIWVIAYHIGLANRLPFFDPETNGATLAIQGSALLAAVFGGGLTYYRTRQIKRANDQKEIDARRDNMHRSIELLSKEGKIAPLMGLYAMQRIVRHDPTRRYLATRAVAAYAEEVSHQLLENWVKDPNSTCQNDGNLAVALDILEQSSEFTEHNPSLHQLVLGKGLFRFGLKGIRVSNATFLGTKFQGCEFKDLKLQMVKVRPKLHFNECDFVNVTFEWSSSNDDADNQIHFSGCTGTVVIDGEEIKLRKHEEKSWPIENSIKYN